MESSREIERMLNQDAYSKKRNAHGKYRSKGKMISAYDLLPKDKVDRYMHSQKPDLDSVFSRSEYLELNSDDQKELLLKWRDTYTLDEICGFPRWNKINLFKESKKHNINIDGFAGKSKMKGVIEMSNAAKARKAAATAKPLTEEQLNHYKVSYKNFPSQEQWVNTRSKDKMDIMLAWVQDGVTATALAKHFGKDRSYWHNYTRRAKEYLKDKEVESKKTNTKDEDGHKPQAVAISTEEKENERYEVREEQKEVTPHPEPNQHEVDQYGVKVKFHGELSSKEAANRLNGIIALIESTGGRFELDVSVKEVKTEEEEPLLQNDDIKELLNIIAKIKG
ncbi:hypothetical protein CHH61_04335 [Shouchella clausii]|uniref:Uncharacterized protein n=1 Tax=Shouchella clausii TaxID=79880 RepID=A0A268S5N5_SHOCL|nr:hypothetical protein [Shouchella clausii]PAF27246.1 hypothetical protein CHH61_04335 [Shouchella clausii]